MTNNLKDLAVVVNDDPITMILLDNVPFQLSSSHFTLRQSPIDIAIKLSGPRPSTWG